MSASWNRPCLLGSPFLSEGVQCPYFLGNKENADAAAAAEDDDDDGDCNYCRDLMKALLDSKVVVGAWFLSGVAGCPARTGDIARFLGLLRNRVPHVFLGIWETGVVSMWQRKEKVEAIET